ncbi:cytochrome c [Ideonella sp. A 288]|uniref:c-type cytochrome n=1 Tax=Ideonella sp. A 288 TaxID=1962181 RepID=UPI001303E59E|nr:cytochrome c [Ideonella sp. A 288]
MLGFDRWGHTLACLFSGLLLAVGAWAAPATPGSGKDSPPSAVYHNYCSVCHGDKGDGQSRARGSLNPPPRDFTTAQALSELTRDRMIAAVKGGVPGTAMVGWRSQLDDKQIEAVVDYVRDRFMKASSQADASRGRQIYARTCSVCHGDRGTGSVWASSNLRPAPRDFSTPQAQAELTRDRMIASVAAGRPGTAMTGFATQLKAPEIEAVVDYIRLAFMRVDSDVGISGTQAHGSTAGAAPPVAAAPMTAPARPVKVDMSLPLPSGLVGDAAAGRRFYDANCATCHGVKGDGKGPRAYFINPKPRILISADSRAMFNRPAIYAAVFAGKLGTEMPAWSKVLEPQEMANVSEYVFQTFVQPAGTARVATRKNP